MTEENKDIQPTGHDGDNAPEVAMRHEDVAGYGDSAESLAGLNPDCQGEPRIDAPGYVIPAKRKPGRPRKAPNMAPRVVDESKKPFKKRPACENLTDKYPLKKLVFFEDGRDIGGLGVFHDPAKGHSIVLMEIKRIVKDGEEKIIWAYRVVPRKGGGKPLMHHDMLVIRQSSIVPLAQALLAVAEEWFGGVVQIEAGRLACLEEKKQDEIGDKIKKMGGLF